MVYFVDKNASKAMESEIKIKKALETGPKRFSELQKITKLSSRTLAKRLEELERRGEVIRTVKTGIKGVFYELIDKKYYLADYIAKKIFYNSFLKAYKEVEENNYSDDELLRRFLAYAGSWIFIYRLAISDTLLKSLITSFVFTDLEEFTKKIFKKEVLESIETVVTQEIEDLSKLSIEQLKQKIEELESVFEKTFSSEVNK